MIVADPVGYVRVMDTSRGLKRRDYLDFNGIRLRDYKQQKGETDQQFYDRKMIASHFRIARKGEPNK